MEDQDEGFIIGARTSNNNLQSNRIDMEQLGIEKIYSLKNFQEIILNKELFDQKSESAKKCELANTKCRWTYWRTFMGLLPIGNKDEIMKTLKQQRQFYYDEVEKYKVNNNQKNAPKQVINPLAKTNNNPYNNFFEDQQLRNTIKTDIERTYQDMEFFQKQGIKNILTNVLFIFAKQNVSLSYKQGMNELVAIITYVFFTESVNKSSKDSNDELFQFCNDETQAEADIYTFFNALMKTGQMEMFRYQTNDKKSAFIPTSTLFDRYQQTNFYDNKASAILLRSKKIFNVYLPNVDRALSKHFKQYHVEPQVFFLRWIRCLCSREFHLDDALNLWDSIFLEKYQNPGENPLIFIDFLCLSMIIFVRPQLLEKDDQTYILQRLLKYPPIESVEPILDMAWKYRGICQYILVDYSFKQNGILETITSEQPSSENPLIKKDSKKEKESVFFSTGLEYKPPTVIQSKETLKEEKIIKQKSDIYEENKQIKEQIKEQNNTACNKTNDKPTNPLFNDQKSNQQTQNKTNIQPSKPQTKIQNIISLTDPQLNDVNSKLDNIIELLQEQNKTNQSENLLKIISKIGDCQELLSDYDHELKSNSQKNDQKQSNKADMKEQLQIEQTKAQQEGGRILQFTQKVTDVSNAILGQKTTTETQKSRVIKNIFE